MTTQKFSLAFLTILHNQVKFVLSTPVNLKGELSRNWLNALKNVTFLISFHAFKDIFFSFYSESNLPYGQVFALNWNDVFKYFQ